MYGRYCEMRDRLGLRDSDVARLTGINKSTFSDWKTGRSVPKKEKLQKIADCFGVSINYFYGVQTDAHHYIDNETARIAQDIFDNPDKRALFEATEDCPPEYLRIASDMLRRLKETNPDG